MFFLMLTFCQSIALDDCQVHRLGTYPTPQQCEAVASVHRAALGPGRNYLIECVKAGDE